MSESTNLSLPEININDWYTDRLVDFVPEHFVKASGLLNTNSMEWIRINFTGRFAFKRISSGEVYFEDPAEATFFSLTWG